MTYVTKEMMEEREQLTKATKFLETKEGQNKELNNFLVALTKDRNTLYFRKNLKFYVFCQIADWFTNKEFLSDRKDERIFIASALATKVCLDIGAKKK